MHEYSIVQALIEQVEGVARSRGATRVQRLQVRIGELSGVEVPLLATAWTAFRDRSLCEGAELDVVPVEARWRCPRCGRTIGRGEILRCSGCGSPARLCQGDEIVLDRIEMEVA